MRMFESEIANNSESSFLIPSTIFASTKHTELHIFLSAHIYHAEDINDECYN